MPVLLHNVRLHGWRVVQDSQLFDSHEVARSVPYIIFAEQNEWNQRITERHIKWLDDNSRSWQDDCFSLHLTRRILCVSPHLASLLLFC